MSHTYKAAQKIENKRSIMGVRYISKFSIEMLIKLRIWLPFLTIEMNQY